MAKRVWMVCLCVTALWSLVYAQGYRIEGNRIVVEGEDWKAWDYPKGVLEFDEEGGLKPRFVHKNINACLDATQFEGGVKDAGTSLADVANVMDGDRSTFWEPDKDAPLADWWFEIDLGRCVSATKIVLKFVEEGEGDPFYQFKVETTLQGKPSEGAPMIYYKMAGKTTQPNEHQRIFGFELSVPSWMCSEAFRGDVIQYVRVRVMGTRGGKAEEISEAEYKVLDPEDRGVVAYYRITAAGKEELTDQEGYEKLPPERKGSVRHYRREHPRLAEIEVWCIGENLSLGIGNRDGKIEAKGMDVLRASEGFDGDFTTGYLAGVHSSQETWTVIDLDATFWIETIRLITAMPKYNASPIAAYQIRVSGEVSESLSWVTMVLKSKEDIDKNTFYFEDYWSPRKVRLIEFRNLTPIPLNFSKSWIVMKEFQIYGEGYVPEIRLTSEIIEVGKSRNLNGVQWVADMPPGTLVEIQTRTGDTLGEEKHYFNKDGVEVSEYQWRYKLPGFMKAPIKIESVPGSDWSPWSRPYEHSGDRFQSPSPKQYLQIRVKLLSDDPYRAASLKSLSIPFTIPLTEAITGTRAPKEVQRLGAPEVFTIKIHPVLQEWHPGFDQLFVQTLDMMEMELVKLAVKKDGRGVVEPRPSTDWTDQVEILPTQPDTLWMVFPDTIKAGDTEEITLQFLSALYRDGTVFNVFVGNTSLPEVYQQVESEDYHAYSKTFMVFAPEKNRNMIDNIRLLPSVFTPNGDGINDVLTVHFTVGRIKAERPVRLTIYDLSGKKVRHMVEQRPKYPLGKYAMVWDGRDEEGRLVPPGLYLVAIRMKSNWHAAENTEVWRRVYVVY